jgi:multiphosphoryl transfer protein
MAGTAARAARGTTVLTGRPGAPGVGVGRALLLGPAKTPVDGTSPPAHDADRESERLRDALAIAAEQLGEIAERITDQAGEEVGAIFVAQSLFARDPGIVQPALSEIATGASAVDAILSVTSLHADKLASVDDEYFRERAADVRDIGRRVAAILQGGQGTDPWRADGHPAVLVAPDLDPSVVATLRRELVEGIVLDRGSPTGHATIVARALGIPLVLGVEDATSSVPEDVDVAVDGSAGRVIIEPDADILTALKAPATTHAGPSSDGEARLGVTVAANIASAQEASLAAGADAAAIGLVRTELVFLGRHRPPSVAEQRATYARIIEAAAGRPVVFRTLDVGGDKPASWGAGPIEANPALGVRGVRLATRDPGTLDDQLRALVEAAGDGPLRVMLPMVATREEVEAVRGRLDEIVRTVHAKTEARPGDIQLGVMIEVPSAAVMAGALAEVADFFSIGTNDLVQYTLAADRTNPELADLASPLQPAVLHLIDGVVRAASPRARHVSVCGEAAGDPLVIPILVGLGVEELSVTPSVIGRVRATLAGLDRDSCTALAAKALAAGSLAEVRQLVEGAVER